MSTRSTIQSLSAMALFSLAPSVQQVIAPGNQAPIPAEASGEIDPGSTLFGLSVCALGDLDGDSVEDFAVGAPVAYSDGGRTGSVLIFSGRSFEVLQRFDGEARHDWYGWSLTPLGDLDGDGACDMAIGSDTWYWGAPSEHRVGIVSPKQGKVIAMLKGYQRCLGRFRDEDHDGTLDLLLVPASGKGETCEVFSSRDLSRLGASHVPRTESDHLVGDFDSDGTMDYAIYSQGPPCRVTVYSGEQGKALREYPIPVSGEGLYESDFRWMAADLDRDGHRDLLINASSFDAGQAKLVGSSGLDGSQITSVILGECSREDIDFGQLRFTLFDAGDPDSDGVPDFLVASYVFCASTLSAYSTRTSQRLWSTGRPETGEADAALALLRDRNKDGFPEILEGAVLFIFDGPQWGENGTVTIHSGKDGKELALLSESKVYDLIGPKRVPHGKK